MLNWWVSKLKIKSFEITFNQKLKKTQQPNQMAQLSDSKHSSNLSEFTDDEIREQLECLGFKNVSKDKFSQFKTGWRKYFYKKIQIFFETKIKYFFFRFRKTDHSWGINKHKQLWLLSADHK